MRYDPRQLTDIMYPPGTTNSEIALELGVNRRTVQRWRTGHTRIDQWIADRLACRLGIHPANIWPNWFDDD